MKLIRADWIIIVAIGFFVVAHMSTNFLIKYYEDAAQTIGEAKKVVQVIEANPIARELFLFNNFRYLFQMLILPSFYFGSYYYIRRKYISLNPELLETISATVSMVFFLDAMNDISLVIGVLAK